MTFIHLCMFQFIYFVYAKNAAHNTQSTSHIDYPMTHSTHAFKRLLFSKRTKTLRKINHSEVALCSPVPILNPFVFFQVVLVTSPSTNALDSESSSSSCYWDNKKMIGCFCFFWPMAVVWHQQPWQKQKKSAG